MQIIFVFIFIFLPANQSAGVWRHFNPTQRARL
jgi:hypothetical protein